MRLIHCEKLRLQGTLVAQGAFSIYDRKTLLDVGCWLDCVGEDIVLTWAILRAGWRVGHAEDACCFTNVPDTLKQFIRQRQRWARGMMEAFRRHWSLLAVPRMSMLFVWWNLLFPWLDALGNVTLGPRLRGEPLRKDVRERALELLERVGLRARASDLPSALSGGMRQRVALARTLMDDRPVVLMDEPFSALSERPAPRSATTQ